MATIADLAAELVGWIPKLPPPLAETLVNRAYLDICNTRLWSFLAESAQIYSPALVDDGTCSVAQFSNQVTFDATASAVLLVQALNTGAPLTTRQFRVSTSGPIYNIIAADVSTPAAIVITLDKIYMGETDTAASYQVYKMYYDAPAADFLRWMSFYDPSSGYTLRINKNSRDINDPLRSQQGQPYIVANYTAQFRDGAKGTPIFELWPAPTFEKAYVAVYQRRGAELASDASLPIELPDELVMSRAKMRAGMWAIANMGAIPELRGSDWRLFISGSESDYKASLTRVQKADEETYIQNLIRMKMLPSFPLDSNYLQSHAPYGPGYNR